MTIINYGNLHSEVDLKNKIDPIHVYPGSFCPPTLGHLQIALKASKLFSTIYIVCSTNPCKDKAMFSEVECTTLWRHYRLPANVKICTFTEFSKKNYDSSRIVIIRGIRDENDLNDEKKVISLNFEMFGIDKYFFVLSEDEFKLVSSSKVRSLAEQMNIEELGKYVSPMVISVLLEKVLSLTSLFMVVGKPGGGKTTFLRMLSENIGFTHINTDEFNHELKPLIEKTFKEKDLAKIAINNSAELKALIKKPWLRLLRQSLLNATKITNVFVEVPYGLQFDKAIFRFIGGRVIYVGCENENSNLKRISQRGTPNLAPFIETIPSLKESIEIARKHQLSLWFISTKGSVEKLKQTTTEFISKLTNITNPNTGE